MVKHKKKKTCQNIHILLQTHYVYFAVSLYLSSYFCFVLLALLKISLIPIPSANNHAAV